jgi:flagella basal body P-ring formation protein FlgA
MKFKERTLPAIGKTLAAVAALLNAAACAEAASVCFKTRASVASTLITLGDVADITDADAQAVERLKRLSLAPAPGAGRQARLDFNSIRARLLAHGVNLGAIEFTGSSSVEVSAVGEPSSDAMHSNMSARAEELQRTRAETLVSDAIRNYLRGLAPELGLANVMVELNPADVPLILTGVGSGFHVVGGAQPWDAPQLMTVSFQNQHETICRVTVQCRIAPQPHVLVARHAIQRGQILREADLTWQQMNATGDTLSRLEDALGRETTKTIRQGEPIRVDDMQALVLVRSSDIVKTSVRKGSITVVSYLKARSSGGLGDSVTLMTLDGRERILARVTGLHEAEVIGAPNGNPAPGVTSPNIGSVPSTGIQLTSGITTTTNFGPTPGNNRR